MLQRDGRALASKNPRRIDKGSVRGDNGETVLIVAEGIGSGIPERTIGDHMFHAVVEAGAGQSRYRRGRSDSMSPRIPSSSVQIVTGRWSASAPNYHDDNEKRRCGIA